MISAYFLEFGALALALTGLIAVVWEIAAKDSRLFREIATDVQAMAEPRKTVIAQPFTSAPVELGDYANNNGLQKAA